MDTKIAQLIESFADSPVRMYSVTILIGSTAKNISLLTLSAEQARISVCTEMLPHMAWKNNDLIVVKPMAYATDSGRWKYLNGEWIKL